MAPSVVLVFDRARSSHFGFYVGEDGRHYYVLGGNRSDAVKPNDMMLAQYMRRIAKIWVIRDGPACIDVQHG